MASSTSSASAGDRAPRRRLAALAVGLAAWGLLAPAAAVGQEEGEEALSPYQEAAREIRIAEAAVRRVQQLRRHPDFDEATRRGGEELRSSLDRGQRLLATAKDGLKSAAQRRSDTGFSDAGLLARRAARELDAYEERLRGLFQQIEKERAPPPPPPPPTVEPSPPVAPPPPARRTPPRRLRQAADAYFAGDYEQAVAILDETKLSSKKARAHAALLRAAARYALFLLGGETDYALRGLATDDVAACRREDPDLAPLDETFSPRFRDFFAATAPAH